MKVPDNNLPQNEYQTHLNRAIDYIHSHYHEDLNLTQLAKVACFSKFHFHRLFHAMVGETLNDFIQRIRLEKSVPKLTRCPSKSITEIALDCGFSCSQNYSKAFKVRYGVTPSAVRQEFNWDELKLKMNNLGVKKINDLNPSEAFLYYTYQIKRKISIDKILDTQQGAKIKIEKMPELQVAYIRRRGPHTMEAAESSFRRLMQWAEARDLINNDTMYLSILWNSPSITPDDKMIRDECITVPPSVKTDKWMTIQTVPSRKFAINRCEVEHGHLHEAWMRFVLQLLIYSDYQMGERPFYQIWYRNSESKSSTHWALDLCLPIKSLYE